MCPRPIVWFAAGAEMDAVQPLIAHFKAMGMRVSVFVGRRCRSGGCSAGAGADRIELYTEPYAHACARVSDQPRALPCAGAAISLPMLRKAREAGLAVNAGHDLNLHNLPLLLRDVAPDEVSIGHAFIADALLMGLAETTRAAYCRMCHGASRSCIGRRTAGADAGRPSGYRTRDRRQGAGARRHPARQGGGCGRSIALRDALTLRAAIPATQRRFAHQRRPARRSARAREIAIHPVPCLDAPPEAGKVSADAGRAATRPSSPQQH